MSVLLTLFSAFIQANLFSAGDDYATIPLIQFRMINIHRSMTMEEFTDLIIIAEMTPDPISINSFTFVGVRLAGPINTILCAFGCIIPSLIICLTLVHFYYKCRGLSGIQTVSASLRPAVVVLTGSTGASILMLAFFNNGIFSVPLVNIHWIKLVLFLGCLFILRKWKASTISVAFGNELVGTLVYPVF